MAIKLKPLLDKLLSPYQTGFLKQRSILHGFFDAQQIIQKATKQKAQMAIFKADIYKAFDTIDWDFLALSLRARGFPNKWIECVQNRVLKGSSRIILNSIAGRAVHLKRGVRQSDPIAPYLFNLAIDFLPKWITSLAQLNFLSPPFPQCNMCLLYADDTILFLKPDRSEIIRIKLLLDLFSKISGLTVNLNKSKLLTTSSSFSLTQNLASIIQCKPAPFPIKYLGLPLSDKGLKRADYHNLIEKAQAALTGWKASLLSIGGRITLVNAVLSAIPQYFMSIFMLPK